MAMFGRVIPDRAGRPSLIRISAHARRMMGDGHWEVEVQGESLIFRPDPLGRSFGKTNTLALGPLLDQLNADGALTDEPFPIRRRGSGDRVAYEFQVRSPDPALGTRGPERSAALPMQVRGRERLARQTYSLDEFARLFALAEAVRGEPVTEDDLREATDDLLGRLPSYAAVLGRMGTWGRFRAFVDYQAGRLARAGLDAQAAHEQLDALLERGE